MSDRFRVGTRVSHRGDTGTIIQTNPQAGSVEVKWDGSYPTWIATDTLGFRRDLPSSPPPSKPKRARKARGAEQALLFPIVGALALFFLISRNRSA